MKRKLTALVLALAVVCMLVSCGLTVKRPQIEKGEFDFSITYALNGKEKTLSAVYVCEFDGVSWTLDGGYGRDWRSHTVGDYEGDDYSAVIGKTEDGGDVILFFGIYPEYFMNDTTGDRGIPEPSVYVTYNDGENGEIGLINDPAEVEELCGAKIIRAEYAEPIENTFR